VHAWQGGQQGAVHEFELVCEVGEPGIAPGGGDFVGEFEEYLLE
jgi:hypothetical protein